MKVSCVQARKVMRITRLTGIGGSIFVLPDNFVEVCPIEAEELLRRRLAVAVKAAEFKASAEIAIASASGYEAFQPRGERRASRVHGWIK